MDIEQGSVAEKLRERAAVFVNEHVDLWVAVQGEAPWHWPGRIPRLSSPRRRTGSARAPTTQSRTCTGSAGRPNPRTRYGSSCATRSTKLTTWPRCSRPETPTTDGRGAARRSQAGIALAVLALRAPDFMLRGTGSGGNRCRWHR
jgi:hypothetical protein